MLHACYVIDLTRKSPAATGLLLSLCWLLFNTPPLSAQALPIQANPGLAQQQDYRRLQNPTLDSLYYGGPVQARQEQASPPKAPVIRWEFPALKGKVIPKAPKAP
ncbi:MAG: hypothetical protein SFZ03_04000 [Candidatus Melainabacteria bacterium]|nr:hypothetical protein [Candidatus Melainabacteria bacterium]